MAVSGLPLEPKRQIIIYYYFILSIIIFLKFKKKFGGRARDNLFIVPDFSNVKHVKYTMSAWSRDFRKTNFYIYSGTVAAVVPTFSAVFNIL